MLPSEVYLHTEPPTPPPVKFCQVEEGLVRKQCESPHLNVGKKASPHFPHLFEWWYVIGQVKLSISTREKNKYECVKITSA